MLTSTIAERPWNCVTNTLGQGPTERLGCESEDAKKRMKDSIEPRSHARTPEQKLSLSLGMTFLKDSVIAIRRVDSLVYCCIILILACYISIDAFTRATPPSKSSYGATASPETQLRLAANDGDDDECTTAQGHMPENPNPRSQDPWRHMKWIGKPARCRVRGHEIEALDAVHNFRRGYALKYTGDVEDKTHILPWLLGSRQDLNKPARRVYIDLGGNRFSTSVTWFMRMYPCDFTEVHVFEVDKALFQLPGAAYDESGNVAGAGAVVVNETPRIPDWMVRRMKVYNVLVADEDDGAAGRVNITRFMKETLALAAGDAVVVKMDIEGSEWDILRRWMHDTDMRAIVDELFVEIHYADPSMSAFGWMQFHDHSRHDAVALLAGLRAKGFFAHAWP